MDKARTGVGFTRQVCHHDLLGGLMKGYQTHFQVAGSEQIPVLKPVHLEDIPQRMFPFDARTLIKDPQSSSIHFYKDDSKFVSVVADPLLWVGKLQRFRSVLTPDLSLSSKMAPWQRVKNTVYSRAVGAVWQAHGITVIPSIRWATQSDYEFVGDGIASGSTISFGAHGTYRDFEKRWLFEHGVEAMLERLSPKSIIIYGRVDTRFLQRVENKVQVHNFIKTNPVKTQISPKLQAHDVLF